MVRKILGLKSKNIKYKTVADENNPLILENGEALTHVEIAYEIFGKMYTHNHHRQLQEQPQRLFVKQARQNKKGLMKLLSPPHPRSPHSRNAL